MPPLTEPDYISLADPTDFCRACKGSGTITYRESGKRIHEPCDGCGGHGHKTAVIRRYLEVVGDVVGLASIALALWVALHAANLFADPHQTHWETHRVLP